MEAIDFFICSFEYGNINISSAKSIIPDEYYRKLSVTLLQENFSLLSNSILTEQERENIQEGIIF